jgi:protease I
MENKKVLLVVASEGYQPIEFFVPRSVLVRNGVNVDVASNKKGIVYAGYDGTNTESQFALEDVDVSDYDGIFFIGGPQALEYLDNEESYKIVRAIQEAGKAYGAICISTRILAKAGVLQNKKATGHNADGRLGDILQENGAEYVEEPVVIDGNIVTAEGPAVAYEFGESILKVI